MYTVLKRIRSSYTKISSALKRILRQGRQRKCDGNTVYLGCADTNHCLLSPLPRTEYKAKRQILQQQAKIPVQGLWQAVCRRPRLDYQGRHSYADRLIWKMIARCRGIPDIAILIKPHNTKRIAEDSTRLYAEAVQLRIRLWRIAIFATLPATAAVKFRLP